MKARETKELKDLLDKQEKVREYRKHTADRLLRYVILIDKNRVGDVR